MKTEEKVIKFYILCNRLKDISRTGWKDWKVKRNRLESIAEHIWYPDVSNCYAIRIQI